ncbi:MAG: YfcE family phosphodiesterase [Firmicutes bacterium]|nr:YfcE family phosphodiesterase [Bacillota bacterium]
MKILLISDTHGMVTPLKNDVLPKYASEVQLVVHLGDYVRDLMGLRSSYPNLEMVGVGGSFESQEKAEHILTLGDDAGNRRLLFMHGHSVDVKTGLDRIMYYAQQKGVDACFFGHTHESVTFVNNGIFFMNPGSVAHPRGGLKGTIGLVSISPDGEITGEVVYA